MSALRTYLRNGGTIENLLSQYAIKAVRHRTYQNLILFKYNQIESPFREPIVQSARGTILDELDNWRHVSRPFSKFFNYGEGLAATIDWSKARVLEKLDGSLVCLYFYAGKWHVQTSGTPDATGDVNGMGLTFADLFWQVFGELKLPLPSELPSLVPASDVTFLFELTTPYAMPGYPIVSTTDCGQPLCTVFKNSLWAIKKDNPIIRAANKSATSSKIALLTILLRFSQ